MTVRKLIEQTAEDGSFVLVQEGENLDGAITKPYCCDLLSIAMGRAPEGCAWITVMANMNTLAVASLTGAACIILAEGMRLDEAAKRKAAEQRITVFQTELPVFEAAFAVYQLLSEKDSVG